MSDSPTDEELFGAYIRGDTGAFDTLFERWAPRIARLMSHRIYRQTDVQELTQQTFLQLHRARHDFRPGAQFRPWLVTIALNLRRQHGRWAHRARETPLEQDKRIHEPETLERLEKKDTAKQVRQAIAQLKPKQREVIELHWFEGLPFAEIAQVLGASKSAVKVRAHRGYAALRNELSPKDVTSESHLRTPTQGD